MTGRDPLEDAEVRMAVDALRRVAERIGKDVHELQPREYRRVRIEEIGVEELPSDVAIGAACGGWQRAREFAALDHHGRDAA